MPAKFQITLVLSGLSPVFGRQHFPKNIDLSVHRADDLAAVAIALLLADLGIGLITPDAAHPAQAKPAKPTVSLSLTRPPGAELISHFIRRVHQRWRCRYFVMGSS